MLLKKSYLFYRNEYPRVLSIQERYQSYHFDVLLFSALAKAIRVIKLDILVVTVFKKVIYMIRMRSPFVVSVYKGIHIVKIFILQKLMSWAFRKDITDCIMYIKITYSISPL